MAASPMLGQSLEVHSADKVITNDMRKVNRQQNKQEIAANCEKYIRAKDTQFCLLFFHQNSN